MQLLQRKCVIVCVTVSGCVIIVVPVCDSNCQVLTTSPAT